MATTPPDSEDEPQPDGSTGNARSHRPAGFSLALALFVIQRIVYHSVYLRDMPFAVGTFSDGRLYEDAAYDLLSAWPLGTQPQYLQGAYAYFLALPMHIKPWISLGLLLQLLVGCLALIAFHRTATRAFGARAGDLSTLVLLAYPGLAFYENKYLTAEIGVAANIACLWALGRFIETPRVRWAAATGIATALAVLARGNMLLAAPATAAALWWTCRARRTAARPAMAAWLAAGLLTLAPLAARNALVTGRATIFPSHGGGTSFLIGNNPGARGIWNSAGDLLSGDVVHERQELAERLGLDPDAEATLGDLDAAIGSALRSRAWDYIRTQPLDWLALEAKKVWLVAGNDELAQDYDPAGERELLAWSWARSLGEPPDACEPSRTARALATATRIGVPFGVVLGLGAMGAVLLTRRVRTRDAAAIAWAFALGGQVFAIVFANVVFFTSSQHRVPLAVPLAFVSGPVLVASGRRLRGRGEGPGLVTLGLGAVLMVQAIAPRSKRVGVSAVHYYNLALVQDRIGEPADALQTLDRAVRLRPDHALFLLERAKLLVRFGRIDAALRDLDRMERLPSLPDWAHGAAGEARMRAHLERRLAEAAEAADAQPAPDPP